MKHCSIRRDCDIAIIGAGPYGLSLAAHLRESGLAIRVFGRPMETWAEQMPEGMSLKSEGFASNLSDPDGAFPLSTFCRQSGMDYADIGLPVSLKTFVAYGQAFQKRFAPQLEPVMVERVDYDLGRFQITLATGEVFLSHRVVVAIGLTCFASVPALFEALPKHLRSHSSQSKAVRRFAGRTVAVVGAGASALNAAAELVEVGAKVHVVARRPTIMFGERTDPARPLKEQIQAPMSGLGQGWRSRFCTDAPLVFHAFPERLRHLIVKKHLGPAPGWFVKARVQGRIDAILGHSVEGATVENGQVVLRLADSDKRERTLSVDHVIAATGYTIDVRRIAFFDENVRERLVMADHTPVLSRHFETSIPGLYFIGTTAANSFGPLLRFIFGTKFAAKRLSRHLQRSEATRPFAAGRLSPSAAIKRLSCG